MKKIKKIINKAYIDDEVTEKDLFFLNIDEATEPEMKDILKEKRLFRLSKDYSEELKNEYLLQQVMIRKSSILKKKGIGFLTRYKNVLWSSAIFMTFFMAFLLFGFMVSFITTMISTALSSISSFVLYYCLLSGEGWDNKKPYPIILMKNSRGEIIHQRDYIFHHLNFKSESQKSWWIETFYDSNDKVVNFFNIEKLNKEIAKHQKHLNEL